jgi:hypothetical protein
MESRLPRFIRATDVASIAMTPRDREIIHLVWRHRFLRSSAITATVGGSHQQIVRRLQLLYHHGYLERPRCQIDYYYRGGSRPIVYGLSDKGARFLRHEGFAVRQVRYSENNRSVGRIYLEHALLVSDVVTAMRLACNGTDARLLIDDDLGGTQPFRWKISMSNKVTLGVIPDRVFGVKYRDKRGAMAHSYFFLEADRGTMPVIRKNLLQTSLYRKLLAYEATWTQSIHQTRFGFDRIRVLFVTTGQERVDSLVDASAELKRGRGLFLFADKTILRSADILQVLIQTGNAGEFSTLLD